MVLPDTDYYWSNYKARTQNVNIFANIKAAHLPLRAVENVDHQQAFIYEIAMAACDVVDINARSPIGTAEFRRAEAAMTFDALCDWVVEHVDHELHRDPKYIGYHRYWWNRDKARQELYRAGFRQIWDSGFGQSSVPVLRNPRYFDLGSYYQDISLYMEVVK